jgi:hypothetical protein
MVLDLLLMPVYGPTSVMHSMIATLLNNIRYSTNGVSSKLPLCSALMQASSAIQATCLSVMPTYSTDASYK